MNKGKLISTRIGLMLFLGFISSEVYAEYYVVSSPPAIHYVTAEVKPACHIKRHHVVRHHHKHHRYHRPVYHKPKSHAEIAIYHVWDITPAVCACQPQCVDCAPCSSCGYSPSTINYVPASQSYLLDEYDGEFDFDRRTADDIGNGMNIDY